MEKQLTTPYEFRNKFIRQSKNKLFDFRFYVKIGIKVVSLSKVKTLELINNANEIEWTPNAADTIGVVITDVK